jgi:hypothetical protein
MKNITFQNSATRSCKKARASSLSSLTGRGAGSGIGGTIDDHLRYITEKRQIAALGFTSEIVKGAPAAPGFVRRPAAGFRAPACGAEKSGPAAPARAEGVFAHSSEARARSPARIGRSEQLLVG